MSWSKAGKTGENLGQSSGHENKDKWVGLESFSEMTGPDLIMSMRVGKREEGKEIYKVMS